MRQALRLLETRITRGGLRLLLPGGIVHEFGPDPRRIEWHIHDVRVLGRMARNPDFEVGAAYVNGGWDAGPEGPAALLCLLVRNLGTGAPVHPVERLLALLTQQWNRLGASYRNVAHHYDLPDWLFERFLDADRHYSCAYYTAPGWTLEQAQQAKCALIQRKLLLAPGQHVLDVGCGWGSLALYLARHGGVRVTGVTLSRSQLEVARRRAREQGLADVVRFELADYRQHRGHYDRIVSVGMFEHVGRPHFRRFFAALRANLAADGVLLLHHICRLGPPSYTSAWIRKHIFPGGYNPSLSEVLQVSERAGLRCADLEVWRTHYACTLADWQQRFRAVRAEVVARLGERFCRVWEFYLAASEAALREGDLAVAQWQMGADLCAVPLTRDYLHQREQRQTPRSQASGAG